MKRSHTLCFVLGIMLGITLAASLAATQIPAASVSSPFLYTFNSPGTLREAPSADDSTSPYFWLNSGAYLVVKDGVGETVQGALPESDPWRALYWQSNPGDTGGGYYPQNVFRLVTRSVWGNAAESVYFRITALESTDTQNRDGWSGVFLFSRYQDGDNLYYAGVRDDGQAIIKKKINGAYYTLASAQIFGVADRYDKYARPSLLPVHVWTGLKMTAQNAWDGSVLIRVYLDRKNDGRWVSILAARDSGTGGAPLRAAAHAGIRTDYKDMQFDNYRLESL